MSNQNATGLYRASWQVGAVAVLALVVAVAGAHGAAPSQIVQPAAEIGGLLYAFAVLMAAFGWLLNRELVKPEHVGLVAASAMFLLWAVAPENPSLAWVGVLVVSGAVGGYAIVRGLVSVVNPRKGDSK